MCRRLSPEKNKTGSTMQDHGTNLDLNQNLMSIKSKLFITISQNFVKIKHTNIYLLYSHFCEIQIMRIVYYEKTGMEQSITKIQT